MRKFGTLFLAAALMIQALSMTAAGADIDPEILVSSEETLEPEADVAGKEFILRQENLPAEPEAQPQEAPLPEEQPQPEEPAPPAVLPDPIQDGVLRLASSLEGVAIPADCEPVTVNYKNGIVTEMLCVRWTVITLSSFPDCWMTARSAGMCSIPRTMK